MDITSRSGDFRHNRHFCQVTSLQGDGTFFAIIASPLASFAKIANFTKIAIFAKTGPLLASYSNHQRLATIGVRAGGARGGGGGGGGRPPPPPPPPPNFGQLRFFGQHEKIWGKPDFKDVSCDYWRKKLL